MLLSHPDIRTLAPLLLSLSYRADTLVMVFTDFLLRVDCTKGNSREANQEGSTKIILPSTGLTSKGIEAVKAVFK